MILSYCLIFKQMTVVLDFYPLLRCFLAAPLSWICFSSVENDIILLFDFWKSADILDFTHNRMLSSEKNIYEYSWEMNPDNTDILSFQFDIYSWVIDKMIFQHQFSSRCEGKCEPNVALMLVHRLRRWPNIKPKLGQCIVFAGNWSTPTFRQWSHHLINLLFLIFQ